MILSALCLEVELFTMALLKTINAALYGSTLQEGLLERFSLAGNVISRNATPMVYTPPGATSTYYYPSTTFTNSPTPGADTVTWKNELVQDEEYLFRSLFPEGTFSDDGTFETPKVFTAENAGGESVIVADSIDSLELAGPVFSFPLELNLIVLSDTIKNGVRTFVQSSGKNYSSSIIPGFDSSKNLISQWMAGTFNGLATAETATFHTKYNKELITPAAWEDGADSITYSPYCVLTPENIMFKRSMHIIFHFTAGLGEFWVEIRSIYNATDYPVFYYVKY